MLTHGSLFSGIGGFILGAKRAGIKTKWNCEIDPFNQRILKKHYPNQKQYTDITLLKNPPYVDIISGGFPCQDISIANTHAQGIKGQKSNLWKQMLRIIAEVCPRYVLIENSSMLSKRGIEQVLCDLAQIGYDAEWDYIQAQWFGLPHRRERLFILAYPNGIGRKANDLLLTQPCKERIQSRGRKSGRTDRLRRVLCDLTDSKTCGAGESTWTVDALTSISKKETDRQKTYQSRILRIADGVPHRLHRIKALGNTVVPAITQYLFELIKQREMKPLNGPEYSIEINSPEWLRARMEVITDYISSYNQMIRQHVKAGAAQAAKELEQKVRQLRWGYTEGISLYKAIREKLAQKKFPTYPLAFEELSSYNTWFELHPKKIAGTEQPSTSRDFPLKIKGKREDVEHTIESGIQKTNSEMDALRKRAENLRRKFFKTTGLSGLGDLQPDIRIELNNSPAVLRRLVDRSKKEPEHGSNDKQSFDEIVSKYNDGISFEEIQAWVWYKRSLGIPMSGWKQYFISGVETFEQIVTTRETVIKDNHFRDLYTVPAGKVLGRPTKKQLTYDGNTFIIFRDAEGLKWANKSDIRITKSAGEDDDKILSDFVRKGFLFYMDGELVPYPVYAYGNMYDRDLQLREDHDHISVTYGEDVYERHLEVIRECKPSTLSVTNPDTRQRPKILVISEFAKGFTVDALEEGTGIAFEEPADLVSAFNQWLRELGSENFKASTSSEIINYYVNGQRITDKKLSKEEKAEIRTNARNEGEELFERFLHEALTFEDQQKLDMSWNRQFNGQSSLPYHRIPVGFEVSARFKQFNLEIRPAQREAIAFMEALGSGIIAYDVGVGKTMSGIIAVANALFAGQCKRPLIVVPKDTYDKWIKEIIGFKDKKGKYVPGILSNTGITVNEWYNLGTDILRNIKASKPVVENSITVITYEGFRKIGFSVDAQESMFTELANALYQSSHTTERDKEIEYSKLREKVGIGNKGTELDIDVMKFDYFIIDEAHRCKNIFEGVKAQKGARKRFGIQGAVSELGIKAFFLCNYVQRTYGRNVCLLTATPFTNSPLEIYAMLSLVAYHGMKRMGVFNIRSFFELFVQETSEYVVNYAEEIVLRDVIKRFNNRLVLQRLIYNHINYKTGEEAGVKRPCKINLPRTSKVQEGRVIKLTSNEQTLTYLRMTTTQRMQQIEIVNQAVRAAKARSKSGIFRALSLSLNNALSPFLIEGVPEDYIEFVEESPKIKYICDCIRSVKEYHEKRREPISCQVIYLNRGKDFFPLIKEYLEKEIGYKTGIKFGRMVLDEVELLTGDASEAKRENVKEAFNEGVVKVIIGTSTIREGIDLQRKSTVLYNGFPDWNPTDLRQLEGRIWRQGNEHAFVRVVMPLVQDSMDVFVFQKLEEKTARINDIWYRGDRGNVLDLESIDPEEIKFALLTDVAAIAHMKQEMEIKEQERKISLLKVRQSVFLEYQDDIDTYTKTRKGAEDLIEYFRTQTKQHSYIKRPLTVEEFEELNEKQRDSYSKINRLNHAYAQYDEQPNQTDRDILGLLKKISHAFSSEYARRSWANRLDKFGYYVKKKAQADKILRERFADQTPDLQKLIDELKKEIEDAEKQLKQIRSEEHHSELKDEAELKKSAMKVEGKEIDERVAEFARLNYLLSVRFNPEKSDSCYIPSPEEITEETGQEDNDAERLRLRAKALRLRLKLFKNVA